MLPSLSQTHAAVVAALDAACADPAFGPRVLLAGKTPGTGREVWLSRHVAEALRAAGFDARPEYRLPDGGRVDVAVLDAAGRLGCAVEVKLYFCHQYRRRGEGHLYLDNTQTDFTKRPFAGTVRQQAVVLAADFTSMPPDGRALGLYQAGPIARHLASRGPMGFDRFESDLLKRFLPTCDVLPEDGATCSPRPPWTARHAGAATDVRAWTLGLRADAAAQSTGLLPPAA